MKTILRPIRVSLMAGYMDLGGREQQTSLPLNHLDRTQFLPLLYLTYRRGQLLDRPTRPLDHLVSKLLFSDDFAYRYTHPSPTRGQKLLEKRGRIVPKKTKSYQP